MITRMCIRRWGSRCGSIVKEEGMTVALADVMRAIEQYRFSGEVNLAAGTKAFRRGLRNHELFRKLAELAKEPRPQGDCKADRCSFWRRDRQALRKRL